MGEQTRAATLGAVSDPSGSVRTMANRNHRRRGRTTPKGTRPGHAAPQVVDAESVAESAGRDAVACAAVALSLEDYEFFASGTAVMFAVDPFSRAPLLLPKDLLREARGIGGAAGAMLAETVAVYGPVSIRDQARRLFDRLLDSVDDPPSVLGLLGQVEIRSAWLLRDVWRDGGGLYVECIDATGSAELVGAEIDLVSGMIAVNFTAGATLDQVRQLVDADPYSELVEVDLADAAETMRMGLHERAQFLDPPDAEDGSADLAALVAHRFALAGVGREAGAPIFRYHEPDDELRELVIWQFLGMSGVQALPDAEDIARTICDFAGYCDGDVLCWSPARIDAFLGEWVPAKVVADDAWYRHLPGVLREWVLYSATIRELPPEAVAISLDQVDRAMGLMHEHWHDSAMRSPASDIVAAMQADGIDMLDRASVDAWIAAHNRRPRDERSSPQRSGPAADRQ